MKHLLMLLMMASVLGSVVFSQEASQQPEALKIKDRGSWGLQFGLNGLVVKSFQGATISFQVNKENNVAMRYGIDITASNNSEKYIANDLYDPDITTDTKRFSTGISFNAQFIKYHDLNENVAFYLGGGPTLGIHFLNDDSSSGSRIKEYDSLSYSIGAKVVIGGEWYVKKNISLFTEYTPSLVFSYSRITSSDNYTHTTTKKTTHSYQLYNNEARIGFSLYFK